MAGAQDNVPIGEDGAAALVNDSGPVLLEADFIVVAKDGLSVSHHEKLFYEKGETIRLKEDVAKALLRQDPAPIKQA